MKNRLLRGASYCLAAFAATYLFSRASLPFALSPFYSGVFFLSISAGQSFFLAAPVFLAATALAFPSIPYLIRSIAILFGAGLVLFLCRLRRRRFQGAYAVLLCFLTQLAALPFLPLRDYVSFFASDALSSMVSLLVVRSLFARRSRRFSFGEIEKFVAGLSLFALGAGAFATQAFGITPYAFLLAALIPPLSCLGAEGAVFAFCFSLGAIVSSGEGALALPVFLALSVALVFKERRVLCAFCVLFAEACVSFLYRPLVSPYNFALTVSGGLFAAFLPAEWGSALALRFGKGSGVSARAVVNKARLDLSGKLGFVSDALRKTSGNLSFYVSSAETSDAARRISRSLSRSLCEGCEGYKDCSKQAGGETSALFEDTVCRAIEKGKATIVDISPYLGGNCRKIKRILDDLNEAVLCLSEESERAGALKEEREAMAVGLAGIAGVLDVLKKETRRVVTFDGKRERKILSSLAAEGVSASDAMVVEDGEYLSVTVTLPERDAEDPRALRAVARAVGVPLTLESVGFAGAGQASATFERAPAFDAIVGEAAMRKEGSERSGDVKSVTRIRGDRIMVALSDGMGSGGEAFSGANAAIGLVENFYKTGVDEKVVLPLINRLLTVRNDGSFQTLDMCVVSLRTGEADFIKLSAPESVIRRREGSEIVEGGALPLGILREIRPAVSRRKLNPGDVVILSTDGVTDAIGADGVVRVAESCRSNNPQTVADAVLSDAAYVSGEDDKTVIALRLFRRVGEYR